MDKKSVWKALEKIKDPMVRAYIEEALQEQVEREKGCPWCNKGLRFESYLINAEGNTASVKNNEVQTCIAKFCPKCGRRLK